MSSVEAHAICFMFARSCSGAMHALCTGVLFSLSLSFIIVMIVIVMIVIVMIVIVIIVIIMNN